MDERDQLIDIRKLKPALEEVFDDPLTINGPTDLCFDCQPFTAGEISDWLGTIARVNTTEQPHAPVPKNLDQVIDRVVSLGRTLAAICPKRNLAPLAVGYLLWSLNVLIHRSKQIHSFQHYLLAYDSALHWGSLEKIQTLDELGRAIVTAQALHDRCQRTCGMSAFTFFPSSLRQLRYVLEERSNMEEGLFNEITVQWHVRNGRRMILTDAEFDGMLEELEEHMSDQRDREHRFGKYLTGLIEVLGGDPRVVNLAFSGLVDLDLAGGELFQINVHRHDDRRLCIEIKPLDEPTLNLSFRRGSQGGPSLN